MSADGHLLHGGYFLRQARNDGKEPQVHEPICHPEVHQLQDLKTFDNQHWDCGVHVCVYLYVCVCICTRVCVCICTCVC